MEEFAVKVRCYSGQTHAERPLSFVWQGINHEVEKIIRSWLEPGEKHFLIRTGDRKIFHLIYHELDDRWTLIES
jgi:hypothetical protein